MRDIVHSYNEFLNFLSSMNQSNSLNLSKEFNNELKNSLKQAFDSNINGNLKKWLPVFYNIPDIVPEIVDLTRDAPLIGGDGQIPSVQRELLISELKKLHPWRKGPFSLFGIDLDAEWQSNMKWRRIQKTGLDFENKNILDIGCGNGYYIFRMLGAGAKTVLGVDPGILSVLQFKVFQFYLNNYSRQHHENPCGVADVFPVPFEAIPAESAVFDIIFSMGVLYHRKNPLDHLNKIFSLLPDNGTLLLETLVLENDEPNLLEPEKRYAQMRNVFKIPSVPTLVKWLENSNFKSIKLHDVSKTTFEEQRQTPWMTFHSLSNFLDPDDSSKTVEGHQAPVRAILTAKK